MLDVHVRRFTISDAMYTDANAWSMWCLGEKQRMHGLVLDRHGVVVGEPQIFVSPRLSEDKMREGIFLVVAELP